MNSSVLLWLAVLVPAAVIMWLLKWMKRTVAWMFAGVAFLIVIGVGTWRESLASLVTTENSLAGLLCVDVVSVFILIVHAVRKKHHEKHYHHVWTHAVALIAGTAMALTFGDGIHLLRQIRHSPAGTVSALGHAVNQINSGRAASAAPPGQGQMVVGIAVAVLIALIIAAYRFANRKPGKTAGRPALPSGSQSQRSPERMPAVRN